MEKNYEVKSNTDIKKILFLISIIPYAAYLALGIANYIDNGIGNRTWDLYNLFEPIIELWTNDLYEMNLINKLITLIIMIFCVGYPFYYLIDKHNKNKLKKTNNSINEEKQKIDKFFVLYIISFAAYLIPVYFSIFGMELGFMSTITAYGFGPLIITYVVGIIIIPVYPVILILQIIYTAKNYKMLTVLHKRIIKIIVAIILILTIIPSTIILVIDTKKQNDIFKSDKVIIERYLLEEFGETHSKNMEVKKGSSGEHTVETPLLESYFEISLNNERTMVVWTSFYDNFDEQYEVSDKLNGYLKDLYDLPDNIKMEFRIRSLDMKRYSEESDLENLLYTCDYDVNYIKIFVDSYDKQHIIQMINELYAKCVEVSGEKYLEFIVVIEDRSYAAINAWKKGDRLTMNFSGYNYGEGFTIDREKIVINLP